MQNILQNIPQEKQQKWAWLYAIIISALLTTIMFYSSSGDADPELIKTVDPVFLLIGQVIFSLIVFFGLAASVIYWGLKINLAFLFKHISIKEAALTFGILFSFIVMMSVVGEWNMELDLPDSEFETWAKQTEETLKILTEYITDFQSPVHFLLGVLAIAIVPAISEELLFRGLIQNFLFKALKNPHIAIWVSATIFGAIHFQLYGLFPRIFLGALFGYLYLWSKNLLIPVLAHFLNNAIGIIFLYFYQNGSTGLTPEQMEQAAPWPAVLVFTVVFFFLIRYFFHQQQLKNG